MGIKQVKLDVNELTVGMFVSGLDRPWTQTPFPLQGFYLRDPNEIKELKAHCRHVFIDVVKGVGPIAANLKQLDPAMRTNGHPRQLKSTRARIEVAPIKIRRDIYAPPQPMRKEIKNAQQLHQKVNHLIEEMAHNLEVDGAIPIRETQSVASEMVDSVLRNPDAMTWLTRVKEKDEHTYTHSVRSAVWALIFGRHIGLTKTDLQILAMGVLLKDVGKTRLPKDVLEAAERTLETNLVYQDFVNQGVEILRGTAGVSPRVIAVVKHHCERIDGSGFPQKLEGDKIPFLARIAGIVTFYDDTTNPRGARHPLAPSKTVARLYDMRGKEFQEQLVIEFIRAIGLYPTGTLVELSTGEVGVVVEQNFSRRLKPKIMVVLDACKDALETPYLMDLAEDDRHKQALIDSGKKSLQEVEKIEIIRDLEPGSCDVDIANVRDNYILGSAKRGLLSFFRSDK